jgi:hypothetical protein
VPQWRRRFASAVPWNESMDLPRNTPHEAAPADESRWNAVINWLALLMLLAGSVVWPR